MPDAKDPAASRRMVQKLLEPPKLSIDRLPVLHTIFERVATTCSESLRQYCAAPTTFFVNQVKTANSWDVLEDYEDAVAIVYYVPEWDASVLIGLDRKFIFALIETTYGADGTEPPYNSDRPFSAFEARFAKEIITLAGEALESSFESVANITFKFERLETKVEFTIMGPNDVPAVAAQILFQVADMGGRMVVLMPQSALYPIRKKLEREHQPVSLPNDPRWTRQMQTGVARTDVRLQAILEKKVMTLGDVTDLQVGQLIQLSTNTSDLITLESGSEPLFRCRLAQSKGAFIVLIETTISTKDEFIGEILNSPNKPPHS
jgi:flagellar motor switch protein FliM